MRLFRILKLPKIVVVGGFAYFLISLFQVWNVGHSDQTRDVDAIIVLGAAQYDGRPSPQLQSRLDHALELWNLNIAKSIIVTGGKQPTDRFTEAQASKKFLESSGVATEKIIVENFGRTTYQSLSAVAVLADSHQISTVLIVSDPFHELRAKLIAKEVGLSAFVSPTRRGVVNGFSALRHNLQEAVGVSVGRIIGFHRLENWVN